MHLKMIPSAVGVPCKAITLSLAELQDSYKGPEINPDARPGLFEGRTVYKLVAVDDYPSPIKGRNVYRLAAVDEAIAPIEYRNAFKLVAADEALAPKLANVRQNHVSAYSVQQCTPRQETRVLDSHDALAALMAAKQNLETWLSGTGLVVSTEGADCPYVKKGDGDGFWRWFEEGYYGQNSFMCDLRLACSMFDELGIKIDERAKLVSAFNALAETNLKGILDCCARRPRFEGSGRAIAITMAMKKLQRAIVAWRRAEWNHVNDDNYG